MIMECGVETYNVFGSCDFNIRATLLWTINDFPAYANLSGSSTKGYLACPSCNVEASSIKSSNGHKCCYIRHHRFLEGNYKWRFDKKSFDGTIETRFAPKCTLEDDVLDRLHGSENVVFGKVGDK